MLNAAVSSRLSRTQRRFKHDFDKNVRREPTFKIEDYVFIDRSQFATGASDSADEMANRRYIKLLRRMAGQ